MTALIVIGSILLFFALILSLRAKITVEYNGEVALTLRVLLFNIKILPRKKKRAGPHSMSPKKAEKIKKKLQAKQEKRRKKLWRKNKKSKRKRRKSARVQKRKSSHSPMCSTS